MLKWVNIFTFAYGQGRWSLPPSPFAASLAVKTLFFSTSLCRKLQAFPSSSVVLSCWPPVGTTSSSATLQRLFIKSCEVVVNTHPSMNDEREYPVSLCIFTCSLRSHLLEKECLHFLHFSSLFCPKFFALSSFWLLKWNSPIFGESQVQELSPVTNIWNWERVRLHGLSLFPITDLFDSYFYSFRKNLVTGVS